MCVTVLARLDFAIEEFQKARQIYCHHSFGSPVFLCLLEVCNLSLLSHINTAHSRNPDFRVYEELMVVPKNTVFISFNYHIRHTHVLYLVTGKPLLIYLMLGVNIF